MAETELNALELEGLQLIQRGDVVEVHIKRQLEVLGLIEHRLGAWVVTDLGKLQLGRRR
jgi:hypothetical protein